MGDRCGQSITDAATGDAYDCTLPAKHQGRCKFTPYPAGRDALVEALASAESALSAAREEARRLTEELGNARQSERAWLTAYQEQVRSLDARAAASESSERRLLEALKEIERMTNAHLGWLAGATRDDVHRLLGRIGESAARAALGSSPGDEEGSR